MNFHNRHVMITGASGDIGTAVTKELNELGAKQTLFSGRANSYESPVLQKDGIDVVSLGDYSDTEIRKQVSLFMSKNPKVDSMVCLNGSISLAPALLEPEEMLSRIWHANYWVPLSFIKAFLESASKNDESTKKIIVLSSIAAVRSQPGLAAYGSAKAALESFVRTLSIERRSKNVVFSIYRVGLIESKMSKNIRNSIGKDGFDEVRSRYPLGVGTAENVAEHICQGLSNYAEWVTGNTVDVEGGFLT